MRIIIYCTSIFDRLPCDIKMKLSLFDKLVVPILTYGSEIWGIYEFKEVEKIHMKFCKYILGVKNKPQIVLYMVNWVDILCP